jgi:hypothetical protein
MRVLVPEAAGGSDVDEGQRGELKAKLTDGMAELICRLFPTDGEGVPLEDLKAMSEWVVAEMAKTRMLLLPLATTPAPEPATTLLQPAEATRELSDFGPATTFLGIPGPATTLPSPAEVAAARSGALGTTLAEAAVVRELGIPRPATALSPPAKAAAAHAHGAAKNLLRAEAAPFIKAGSSLKPTGSKVTAHSQTATNASLLPDGVVCGALGCGGAPGRVRLLLLPGWMQPRPRVLVLARQAHGGLTAAGTASESRHAEGRIAPEKETAGNSQKGSPFQEPTKSKGFLSCRGLEQVLRPTAGCHKHEAAYW